MKQIKQEIKNAENSSNLHACQAFKHIKNKTKTLLRELENITDENTNTTSSSAVWPKTLGIGALIVVPVALLAGKVKNKFRIRSSKNENYLR